MEKKSKITAMLSVLLVSAPTTAKKLTTSNLRDNAMRTAAVEVDGTEIEQLEIAKEEKDANNNNVIVLDTNQLKFDFNSATIKEEYTPILEKLKNYIEAKNEKISTKNSKNKTEILVGAGLNIKNIDEIVNFTGATSFHFSGKRIKQSSMEYRKENVNMGLKEFSEFEILETDENLVREVADYLSKL